MWIFGAIFIAACLSGTSQAQTAFDGQYWGEMALTRILGGACDQPQPGRVRLLTISNGQVQFVYNRRFNIVLTGRVDNTGSFNLSGYLPTGPVQMVGRVTGGDIGATAQSPDCWYAYQGKKHG